MRKGTIKYEALQQPVNVVFASGDANAVPLEANAHRFRISDPANIPEHLRDIERASRVLALIEARNAVGAGGRNDRAVEIIEQLIDGARNA